jgi:hypothetical protein
MADHRIRLTDRELAMARSAAWAISWALGPFDAEGSQAYKQLAERLEHTKAGGMPAATRRARKHFREEASGT